MPRRLAIVALLACAGGCAAWSYVGYRIAPDYPRDETAAFDLAGLRAPVTVHLDALGVPHVEAEDERDLLRAVGFLHARARFFQMDILRRYARGRLSELVGEQQALLGSTVTVDATMRGWGFDQAARAEAEGLQGELRGLLDAYVEGVNTGLARFGPVEYRLLRVDPEPWTIADSLAVGHLVAWGITHNWQQEACRLLLALEGGHARAERIYPPEPWPGATSLRAEGEAHPLPPSVVPEVEALFPVRAFAARAAAPPATVATPTLALPLFEGASNGWVLGGGRTVSGMPLLAGDPHLPHTLPSIVFQQHLACPGLDVIGTTVPGIPYVLFGHNRSVAWTITAAMADVLDLYLERPSGSGVAGPRGPEPLVTDEIEVRIRDGSAMRVKTIVVRRTPRGPLLNDLHPDLLPPHAPLVSIHGIPTEVAGTLASVRAANRAGDVQALRAAMEGLQCPISAVSAADTGGEVALFATGTVPLRPHHRGTFPVPAWIAKYAWQGRAAYDDIPHASGRGNAFFVNTNNLMVDPACTAVCFQVDSAPSYRRDRAVARIEATERHTAATNAAIQGDLFLLRAQRVVPVLLSDLRTETPQQERALALLADWDFRAEAGSAACAIFFSTYREAILGALRDEVHAAGLPFLVSFRYFTNAVDLWFDEPDHEVWDDRATAGRETRADVVRAAFRRALAGLEEALGDDCGAWRWGALHTLEPRHGFGSKVGAFNLPGWEAPGGSTSVWKAHFDMGRDGQPFRCLYGPVQRMIVDLADMDHASWIVDTGSSGWPRAPHYGDQHALWQEGRLAPMVMGWKEIRRDAVAVLTLR